MSAGATTELRFDPPGPGFWEQDVVHFPRPVTRYWAEMHPEPFRRGFRELTSYYGMLIDTIDYRYVGGFCYKQVVPVDESEIPARFQRAEEAVRGKLWREQLREWDEQFKPTSIATHRELQAVDPEALSDEELVAYLERCRAHHIEMIYQHMRFTGAAVLPTGDFLAHVGDWTGLPPSELLGLMRGASPVSSGASAELERLLAAIAADPAARELLGSDGDPGETLDRLRSLGGEAGATASTSPAGMRSSCRTRSSARSGSQPRGKPRTSPIWTRRSPPSAAGSPRSIAPSSTSCSTRRGARTGSGTSAASSATSGPRGSCGARWSAPAAGSRRRGGSRIRSTSWTQGSRR
jgi:hypothetical protein